jgi:hypothetical protein
VSAVRGPAHGGGAIDRGGVRGGGRSRGGSVSRITLGVRRADCGQRPASGLAVGLAVRNQQRALAGSTG